MKSLYIFLFFCTLSVITVPVFSQNLSKKQFEKSLARFQKCYARESTVVLLSTDIGNAVVFYARDMIRIFWKERKSENTLISHARILYKDRYESEEDYYYEGFSEDENVVVGSTSNKSCFDKHDKYDRAFLAILKAKKCIPDLGFTMEVYSKSD